MAIPSPVALRSIGTLGPVGFPGKWPSERRLHREKDENQKFSIAI